MSESVVGADTLFVISEFASEDFVFCVGLSIKVTVLDAAGGDPNCCEFSQAASNSGSSVITMFLVNGRKSNARDVSK